MVGLIWVILEFYHGLGYWILWSGLPQGTGFCDLGLPCIRRGERQDDHWYPKKYKLDLPASDSDAGKFQLILFFALFPVCGRRLGLVLPT